MLHKGLLLRSADCKKIHLILQAELSVHVVIALQHQQNSFHLVLSDIIASQLS